MRGAVAERRQADFDISAPPQRACSHIRGADTGGSDIYWGQRWFGAHGFKADAENWVLDPFVAVRILLPLCLHSATAYVWTHVMICVEANFLSASAPHPPHLCSMSTSRMCEHTLTWNSSCGDIRPMMPLCNRNVTEYLTLSSATMPLPWEKNCHAELTVSSRWLWWSRLRAQWSRLSHG